MQRGKTDVKVLIYDSDPRHPDAQEVVGVRGYVASYISKCVKTLSVERGNMRDLILRFDDITGNKFGLYNIARWLLNITMVTGIITKQECMVQLGNLQLGVCSESI